MSIRSSRKPALPTLGLSALIVAGLSLSAVACQDDASTAPETDDVTAVSSAHAAHARARTFTAQLRPLNADFSFRPVHGVAKFLMKDGMLSVRVNASGVQPGMAHPQHVHMSDQCPPPTAAGADGVLNVADGAPYYGAVLFWLDGNLEDPGNNGGLPNPQNAGGAETYTATASVAALEMALGESLDLANRVVVLHGVSGDTDLSADPDANNVSLPIACGTID